MWISQFWSLLYSLLRGVFPPPPIPVIMVLLRKLNPVISIPAFRIIYPWFHSGARGLSTNSKVRRRRAVCKPHKKTPYQSVERLRVLINILLPEDFMIQSASVLSLLFFVLGFLYLFLIASFIQALISVDTGVHINVHVDPSSRSLPR